MSRPRIGEIWRFDSHRVMRITNVCGCGEHGHYEIPTGFGAWRRLDLTERIAESLPPEYPSLYNFCLWCGGPCTRLMHDYCNAPVRALYRVWKGTKRTITPWDSQLSDLFQVLNLRNPTLFRLDGWVERMTITQGIPNVLAASLGFRPIKQLVKPLFLDPLLAENTVAAQVDCTCGAKKWRAPRNTRLHTSKCGWAPKVEKNETLTREQQIYYLQALVDVPDLSCNDSEPLSFCRTCRVFTFDPLHRQRNSCHASWWPAGTPPVSSESAVPDHNSDDEESANAPDDRYDE